MKNLLTRTKAILVATWRAWRANNDQTRGAALAYYTAFSLAPLLLIAIAVAGMAFGEQAARDQLSGQLDALLGESGAAAVEDMLSNTHRAGGGVLATVTGVLTLLFGATGLFAELQESLNHMWDAPKPTRRGALTALRARFLSFGMVLVIGFLLLVSLVFSAVLSGLQARLGGLVPLPVVATLLGELVSLAVSTLLFTLIYKILPDVRIHWRDVAVGAFVTAVLFALGKLLISFYLGNSALATAYGAASSFAVLLVWIYYSAQIVLFGAEFTQVYTRWPGTAQKAPQ